MSTPATTNQDSEKLSAGPSLPTVITWLLVFSVAFAWIESAVVHYLHFHFYPDGFKFPLVEWKLSVLMVEVIREASTMIVLAAVAFFAGRSWWRRLAYFMTCLGIWDIFYYVWLLLFEGWPQSPLTDDLLFLIPVPWAGPVIAPVLVSVFLIVSAALIIWFEEKRGVFKPGLLVVSLTLLSWALILYSFMESAPMIIESLDIGPFNWWVFAFGLIVWCAAIARVVTSSSRYSVKNPHGNTQNPRIR